jgi:hypothetical protein
MCGGIPDHYHDRQPEHQHRPRLGMHGGRRKDSRIVALLCHNMHQAIDNGLRLGGKRYTDVFDGRSGRYQIFEVGVEEPLLEVYVP